MEENLLFKSIAEVYAEAINKADNKGLAKVYKQATELIFKAIKEEARSFADLNITITDDTYLDGYFIFKTGDNSVVHFHIKETPGWKYGIWWAPIKAKTSTVENPVYKTDQISCQIFAQYEEEINKFKPAASKIRDEFIIEFDFFSSNIVWKFVKHIKFIHDEPYLAFYRDTHSTDFNTEYISRAKAKAYFKRHFKCKKRSTKITEINNREMLKMVYSILKEDIDNGTCFIFDRDDCCSPRYEIVSKNPFDPAEVEDGYYVLFDLLEETRSIQAKAMFDKTVKACTKRAKRFGEEWYYHTSCDDTIRLITPDKFDKFIKLATKEYDYKIVDVKAL